MRSGNFGTAILYSSRDDISFIIRNLGVNDLGDVEHPGGSGIEVNRQTVEGKEAIGLSLDLRVVFK